VVDISAAPILLALLTTDLHATAATLVTRYAAAGECDIPRWLVRQPPFTS
jgi:hypothetical protein